MQKRVSPKQGLVRSLEDFKMLPLFAENLRCQGLDFHAVVKFSSTYLCNNFYAEQDSPAFAREDALQNIQFLLQY